jgi:transposase
LEHLESLSREELIQIILNQSRMIERLRAEIEELKRRGSAAPFSKGTRKSNPQPPGRKPGQGTFRFRAAPETAASEAILVGVRTSDCPCCGGTLVESRPEIVSITDIPASPQPEIRRYEVEVRKCSQCGRKVRGQHPAIAADQRGATAHRVGPRIKGLAHVLHYVHGVPVRRTPAIVEELTGIRLTQSTITQDAMRQSGGAMGKSYEQLRAAVREQAVVHTDDTGWRVGGKAAFLMAFVNPWLSVYQIRPRHRNEEVRELIPAEFGGVMICDRGKSYDAEELEGVAQQKCLAHLIRNASEVGKHKTGRARSFSSRLKQLLRQALDLSTAKSGVTGEEYEKRVRQVGEELTLHLRDRFLRDADNVID